MFLVYTNSRKNVAREREGVFTSMFIMWYRALEEADNKLTAEYKELKKENEAHWRQLTQLMKSNPELFEQFSGADEVEQDLIDNGYLVE